MILLLASSALSTFLQASVVAYPDAANALADSKPMPAGAMHDKLITLLWRKILFHNFLELQKSSQDKF